MNASTSTPFRVFLTVCILLVSTTSVLPQNVYRARYYKTSRAIAELTLKDTVTPEFVAYHFRRFGYKVLDAQINPVEALIHGTVTEDDLIRMTYHPFVNEIAVEQQFFDPETPDSMAVKIKFNQTATDDMIAKFCTLHSGFELELLPRQDKKVVIKTSYYTPESLIASLEALIYVDNVRLLPTFP